MKITHEKNFTNRKELDSFIRSRFGDDANANKDSEIELSEEEAQVMSLSEKTTVFGIKCKILKAK